MLTGQRLGRLVLAAVAILAGALLGFAQETEQGGDSPLVLVAAIEGPIGPATTRHVEKVIEEAEQRRAEALVLRLYTPGGLANAMRDIITEILDSRVPVLGYVAPSGAHAASAGTYILYATHVAAMAPATNLGAATPVQIGGMPGAPEPGDGDGEEDGGSGGEDDATGESGEEDTAGEESAEESSDESAEEGSGSPLSGSDAMTAKSTNDAVAFIRGLAELRGRNADWAEKAVREAASLSANDALDRNVIDLTAGSIADLLEQADGRSVTIADAERTLETAGATVEHIEPDTITRLLSVLSNPNVAFVLMMLGIYGLIFEFTNPGAILPGTVGAISLILGLYALNQLPLDYAGLALVLLGIALMVAEAFAPSFGILGISGLVAFVLGSAMLFDTDVPAYQLDWWLIGVMAAVSGSVLVLILGYTLHVYRRGPISGDARMTAAPARVLDWSPGATSGEGYVWTEGERWRAVGPPDLAAGETVRVRRVDGLTLIVERDATDGTHAAGLRGGAEG